MNKHFLSKRHVEFRDTDMAGIVHFSVFFTYMEQAEHELLRSVGMSVVHEIDGQKISWPRVAAECNYLRAIKFEQIITVQVSILRIGDKSVTYRFRFFESEQEIANGKITAVCCYFVHGSRPISVVIPDSVRSLLHEYLE